MATELVSSNLDLAKGLEWTEKFRQEPPLRRMPYQQWMIAMADEIARLEELKSAFAHDSAMYGAQLEALKRGAGACAKFVARQGGVFCVTCDRQEHEHSAPETGDDYEAKGLAVIRAAQLDIAADHLERNGILSLGTACRESAKLLRDLAVPAVKTTPNTDQGDKYGS